MVRGFVAVTGLAMSLMVAREAAAITIVATDLDLYPVGEAIPGAPFISSQFLLPPGSEVDTLGSIGNSVYFDGTNYTYVHAVTPDREDNTLFSTEFVVEGFTGIVGFSFGDSALAGGGGNADDFRVEKSAAGRLRWTSLIDDGDGWDTEELIRFFFVSTNPPVLGDYNLSTFVVGTGQSYAPGAAPVVPEPGTIALLGSGLVGLYAARRRRRNLGA